MLERGRGIALWRQIAGQMRQTIIAGLWEAGAKIPNEFDLAEEFGVHRHTVRRAIAELASDGLLIARRGEGTFVAQPALAYPIGERVRFHEIVSGEGRVPHGRLVAHAQEPDSVAIARALAIKPETPVLRLQTLHHADSDPVSSGLMWLPANRFPNLVEDFQATGSLTKALQAAGVPHYRRDRTQIRARHADAHEIDLLELEPGGIVLVTDYTSFDPDGVPFQHASTAFAAARIQLTVG